MKNLSEKKKIFLLLLETFFQFFTLFIAILFYGKIDSDFLSKNLIYQSMAFIIFSFVYFNLLTINKNLKMASILKFVVLVINLIISLILSLFPEVFLMNIYTLDGLKFVSAAIEIPFVYFLYKGLSCLVLEKSKNKILALKLDKFLTANLIMVICNFIASLITLFELDEVLLFDLSFILIVSSALVIFSVVLSVLKIVYIFKIAKEIA